jgi:hypothetical protein
MLMAGLAREGAKTSSFTWNSALMASLARESTEAPCFAKKGTEASGLVWNRALLSCSI